MMVSWFQSGPNQPILKYWWWIYVVLILLLESQYSKMEPLAAALTSDNLKTANDIECPTFSENSACPCYKFEDGLFLECPGITSVLLKTNLQHIHSPIQSLSIYDFDRTVTTLTNDLFSSSNEVQIKHLQFSHSNIQSLKDNSLNNLKDSLESLSIVNGKLRNVPTKALSTMQKLIVLDFESNEIFEIHDFCFYGLHLVKLNLKGNLLEKIPESTFNGLEESLAEIDLSDNKLTIFPIVPLIKLDYLRSLRLSMNEISSIQQDIGYKHFSSLIFLDLSSNFVEKIQNDYFRYFPLLKTLTLYNNFIDAIHKNAFYSLRELQSIDLSHNNIIYLDPQVFESNKKLHTIDLSHNHVHYINGVFANLLDLEEVLLSENNILELTNDCFSNSTNIKVIYLENNSIQRLDFYVFHTLLNLDQLYLSNNYIKKLPPSIFEMNIKLTSLTLDNNLIRDLDNNVFQNLINLRDIRLNNNHIERIDSQLLRNAGNLMELYLQNNKIKIIESSAFLHCQHLQYINIQENELIEIENIFNFNSTLLSIQLNSNFIKFIDTKLFLNQLNVQILWLENNMLKKLEKNLFNNLLHLDRLYLKNNSIYQINEDTFDKLMELKYLDLSINELMAIPQKLFYKLGKLEELYLGNNLLHSIEPNAFATLKNLKILDLMDNDIQKLQSELFRANLPALFQLNLKRTNLTKIESNAFKGLTNLNELNLDENPLNSWDIKQIDIPGLRLLKISSNNFSTAVREGIFDKLPSLQTLIMVNCNITQLPDTLFTKNTNLVKIDLSDNRLKLINRNLYRRLNVFKELKLDRNWINEFPHMALSNISTLEILSMAENSLNYIDFFKFNGLPNLRQLDLSDNSISSISGFNTIHLPHLDMIDLSGNLLYSLPSNFFQQSISLQRIDLSMNRFNQIPSTALSKNSLARLSWLNLTGNPLVKIYTGGIQDEQYPYLTELHISKTNLTILTSKDFEMFPALQTLNLTHNHINRVSPGAFITLSSLKVLDLSVNEIEILPKERLQGLKLLVKLNVSYNNLKELEEFSQDLAILKVLDISYNQLDHIDKTTLTHLIGLKELFLTGNRLSLIPSDSFKTLRKLETLDIGRNYFENIPLRALKPLETRIKHLRIADNPIHCSCETQELWEWLQDHRKWQPPSEFNDNNNLNCDQPVKLRGKNFLRMEPQDFCDAPLIMKLAIQDIQPYSVLVSWQSREHSGLSGYQVIYHSLDINDEIRSTQLNRSANSARLMHLSSNTLYLICVLGIGNWLTYQNEFYYNHNNTNSLFGDFNNEVYSDSFKSLLSESTASKCTQVRTLYALPSTIEMDGLSGGGFLHSILTRRLGLIVGCCLGIIVFIVLISVLGWLKLKKQRMEREKRTQQMTTEYLTYRSYSISNEESIGTKDTAISNANNVPNNTNLHHPSHNNIPNNISSSVSNCQHHHMHHAHGPPNYISGSVMGTTAIPS